MKCFSFAARNRGIAIPADLENQIQALFTRSQLVMKHTRHWLSHGKVRRDSMMNLSRDYRSIIEGLQVRPFCKPPYGVKIQDCIYHYSSSFLSCSPMHATCWTTLFQWFFVISNCRILFRCWRTSFGHWSSQNSPCWVTFFIGQSSCFLVSPRPGTSQKLGVSSPGTQAFKLKKKTLENTKLFFLIGCAVKLKLKYACIVDFVCVFRVCQC